MAEARKSLMTSSFELFFCWVLVAHKSCIICRLATYLLASHSHLVSENYCRWNWVFSHNFFLFRMLWEWQLKIGRTRSWNSQRISFLKGRGTSGTNLWRWDGEIFFKLSVKVGSRPICPSTHYCSALRTLWCYLHICVMDFSDYIFKFALKTGKYTLYAAMRQL